MIEQTKKLALYVEATMGTLNAKMAEGIIRYGQNPVVAVIDSHQPGKTVRDLTDIDSDIPVVATLEETIAMGAEVLVLGTAPSGGRIPEAWFAVLDRAIAAGMSLVNGLHDELRPRYADQLRDGQVVWDVRRPVGDLPRIAMARAAELTNTRCLMVGTDMAVGKMTAGLEIWTALKALGADAAFLASGQTGICITGTGIPLDAFRVDHASGAVERMVLENAGHDILLIEGQGSLLNPGSTATLPLIRGSCCNKMILCHRAGMSKLDTEGSVVVPPLAEVIALNEAVASAGGSLTRATVVGIALNTRDLDEGAARDAVAAVAAETGLPVSDPVRFGAEQLARAIL